MKKIILFALGFLILSSLTIAIAAEKPRIGVLRFTNITRAYWWSDTTAAELQDMLINELASSKVFQILERKELGSVRSEQRLGESGLVDSSTKSKLGKIKRAKYLVSATVSAFEESTADSGGGLNYRGFPFGEEQKKAYLAIDLKVIDAETGEIVDSRTIEVNTTSGSMRVSGPSGLVPRPSGGLSRQEKTPVGKAIRGCVIEITAYLECSLASAKDDECHQKYSAKEPRRKEKTKSSIQLDE